MSLLTSEGNCRSTWTQQAPGPEEKDEKRGNRKNNGL